jgi:hypothetical protein
VAKANVSTQRTQPKAPLLLKRFTLMDLPELVRMIDKSVNTNENDDNTYYNQLAETVAFMILPHPVFSVRQAALARVGSKLNENSEWEEIYSRAAKKLITAFTNAEDGARKATAIVALTNLVTEIKPQRSNYKDVLSEIRDARIEVSKDASDYANDPVHKLISPSSEAELTLGMN